MFGQALGHILLPDPGRGPTNPSWTAVVNLNTLICFVALSWTRMWKPSPINWAGSGWSWRTAAASPWIKCPCLWLRRRRNTWRNWSRESRVISFFTPFLKDVIIISWELIEGVSLFNFAVLKSSHGSANFGVLGNRSMKNEKSPSGEKQVGVDLTRSESIEGFNISFKPSTCFQSTLRRHSAEGREDTTPRKPLSSPSRAASTPTRSGLSENRWRGDLTPVIHLKMVFCVVLISQSDVCFRGEKRKRLLNSESDLTEDYPKENDSSRWNTLSVFA